MFLHHFRLAVYRIVCQVSEREILAKTDLKTSQDADELHSHYSNSKWGCKHSSSVEGPVCRIYWHPAMSLQITTNQPDNSPVPFQMCRIDNDGLQDIYIHLYLSYIDFILI